MEVACDLEVDVNGEEVFWVDKRILSRFSGTLSNIFNKSYVTPQIKPLKVFLSSLPGGAKAFELILKFCYNHGKIEITPANTCRLHCAAHFMEMTEDVESLPNLIKQTEKSIESIPYWTWSEIVAALKQCQDYFFVENSSIIYEKVLDSLVERISSVRDTSPPNSSPESSGFRFSFDTKSSTSTKVFSPRAWWFEDLLFLNTTALEKVVKMMSFHKVDHQIISRFLLYYFKTRSLEAAQEEKRKIIESVIDLLDTLDKTSFSCKWYFWILRISLPLNLRQSCRSKLETLIGRQIDLATLDNILIHAPPGMSSLYDVDLVLRFLKFFLNDGGRSSRARLKKVGMLMDMYLAEVAPDPRLKTQNFVSLAMALPDEARDSYDGVYHAIDMYIEVHADLSEEERMRICCVLNYEKLSSEICKHLAQNSKLPSRTAIQALVSQQSKLKNLLQNTNNYRLLHESPCRGKDAEPFILYAKKLELSTTENEKLKAHLQGMQWRVTELEKICRKMQVQMTKIIKTGMSSRRNSRSIPKLCS